MAPYRALMRLVLAALAVACSTGVVAGERITIKVSPRVAFAPGRINVRATVPKAAENRALEIIAESIDYYRSSTVHMDGVKAARTTVVQFGGLPRGDYTITARLRGAGDDVLATVNGAVVVTSPKDNNIPR